MRINYKQSNILGPIWHPEIVPDLKNNSNLRGLKVGTILGGSGDCVMANSPQFLEIIPQLAGQLPYSTAEHIKMLSGLKLTVWLQQPLCMQLGVIKGG